MNVYLIGYRGTGKSTLAPLLAARLGPQWKATDLDVELERRAGATIADIFQSQGETAFRDKETDELQIAAAASNLVVATGGGVIGREGNRRRLRDGWVAWLAAPVDVILERISKDADAAARRPNLTVKGGREEVERLLAERTPIYRELADFEISTVNASADELVERIAEAFRNDTQLRNAAAGGKPPYRP